MNADAKFRQMNEHHLYNEMPDIPEYFKKDHDGSIFDCLGCIDSQNFDELLIWAAEKDASDITIQTGSKVAIKVSGKIHYATHSRISATDVESIVRFVYGENGPAEIQSGVDIDLSHEIRLKTGETLRFRVNITGGRTERGCGLQISIRPLASSPIPISKLEVEREIIANFRPRQGIVLITGPTGSGKSTLLSSGIRMIVEHGDTSEKVLEYSSPIEYVYDRVNMPSSIVFQTDAGKHLRPRGESDAGSVYSYCVRNALRRSPTIIVIGEARDRATIESSVEAAMTGHLLYTTMHTTGVAATVRRAVAPFRNTVRSTVASDIMECLRLIVTQILVPRKGGGLVACREFMVFDEDVREQFQQENESKWPVVAHQLMRQNSVIGRTMAESAIELANKEIITEVTLNRIVEKGWN